MGEITNINTPQVKEVIAEGRIMKILSIDMNFIMFPCIKLYFDNVNPEEYSAITWQNLEQRKDIDKFLNMDSDAYLKIIDILKYKKDNHTDFFIIESQKEIAEKLVLDNNGIMYDITNIDFYHDLFVDFKKDKQKLKHFNKYNDMNWVGYIDAKEKLYGYKWISCPNSPILDPELKFNTDKIEHLSYYNIDKLLEDDTIYDHIFISYSPSLVPYKYRFLTDVLYKAFKI